MELHLQCSIFNLLIGGLIRHHILRMVHLRRIHGIIICGAGHEYLCGKDHAKHNQKFLHILFLFNDYFFVITDIQSRSLYSHSRPAVTYP